MSKRDKGIVSRKPVDLTKRNVVCKIANAFGVQFWHKTPTSVILERIKEAMFQSVR